MRTMNSGILLGLILLGLGAPGMAAPVIGGDDAKWQMAAQKVNKLQTAKNEEDITAFKEALLELGDATYDKRDKQTVAMVVGILTKELNEKEERIDGRILEGCESCLRKTVSADGTDALLQHAKQKNGNPRLRFYICRALGSSKNPAVVPALIEIASDEKLDDKIEIGALDGLADIGDKAATALFLKVIEAEVKTWECKIVALRGLVKIVKPVTKEKVEEFTAEDKEALATCETLINALGKLKEVEGRLKVGIIELLANVLGVKDAKTDEPNWWKTALNERKGGKVPGSSGGTTVAPTEFFGLKTKSTRIVFILDRTGSMDLACSEEMKPKKEDPKVPPKGPDTETGQEKPSPADEQARKGADDIKKKHDNRKVEKRIDALRREFINTIYNLDPRVKFNYIYYEGNATAWKPTLVQATWPIKFEAIKDIDSLNPSGPTNIWEALEMAYKFVATPEKPDVIGSGKGNYATVVNGPDTFFLMTDGNHNLGKFANGTGDFNEDQFFAEYKKINTLRKVIVNTIILGDSSGGPDPIKPKSLSLFKRIADDSGGAFAHIGK